MSGHWYFLLLLQVQLPAITNGKRNAFRNSSSEIAGFRANSLSCFVSSDSFGISTPFHRNSSQLFRNSVETTVGRLLTKIGITESSNAISHKTSRSPLNLWKGRIIKLNYPKISPKMGMCRNGLQDMWNAFMVKGAKFSANDIPLCPTTAVWS